MKIADLLLFFPKKADVTACGFCGKNCPKDTKDAASIARWTLAIAVSYSFPRDKKTNHKFLLIPECLFCRAKKTLFFSSSCQLDKVRPLCPLGLFADFDPKRQLQPNWIPRCFELITPHFKMLT